MNSSEPVDGILTYFGTLLTQMEELLDKTSTGMTSSNTHTVIAGDVLWKIASQYNVSLEELMSVNKLQDKDLITIGQKLIIPTN